MEDDVSDYADWGGYRTEIFTRVLSPDSSVTWVGG